MTVKRITIITIKKTITTTNPIHNQYCLNSNRLNHSIQKIKQNKTKMKNQMGNIVWTHKMNWRNILGEQCPIKNTFWPQSSTPMSLQLKMRTSSSSKIRYSRRKTQMNKIIWEMCSLTMILVLINLLTKRNNNDFYIYISSNNNHFSSSHYCTKMHILYLIVFKFKFAFFVPLWDDESIIYIFQS